MTRQTGDRDDEITRVRTVYADYETSGKTARWDHDRSIHAERTALVAAAVRTATALLPAGSATALDLGCGQGRLRADLDAAGVPADRHFGVDLGAERLGEARTNGLRVALASGDRLPFPDATFDIVITATVLSSILDERVLRGVVAEIGRVLKPTGALVVYDMRLPSPGNSSVRPMTARRLADLFRGWSTTRRTCTLLPPLARRLARDPGRRYDTLVKVPLLRSHALTVLRPLIGRPAATDSMGPLRLGFVGPMIGRGGDRVTTQGEVVADLFREDGWAVEETSPVAGRVGRLVDTIRTLASWRGRIDVAIISVFSGPAFVMADVSSALARRVGLPVVLWYHGGNLGPWCRRHPRWARRVLRRADAHVAPSDFLASELSDIATIRVIPNVVDVGSVPFRERSSGVQPRLLWMRTFHPIYNPTMAVRAFARVRRIHPDARLTMAGQAKGSQAEVADEIRRTDLGDAVELPGFLDLARKQEALRDHDIYLHTNDVDNTPVSLIEAAAAGLPIVATRVGGIPHLLTHEETALLVEADDDGAMATAIDRLLDDPTLAAKLSRQAHQLAEGSTWSAVRRQWVDLLQEVQASRP